MRQLVDATHGALANAEASERNYQQRTLLGDGLRLLNQHGATLVKAYPIALLDVFAQGPAKVSASPAEDTGLDFGELALLDEAEMQSQVELARAQQRAVYATDAVLADLNALVSSAQGLRSVQAERNPLRPENYVRALQRVMTDADIAAPVRQLWMQHMSVALGALLVNEYRHAAQSLREHGVEPVGYAMLGVPVGALAAASVQAQGPRTSGAPPSEVKQSSGYAQAWYRSPGEQGQPTRSSSLGGDGFGAAAEEALLTVGMLRQMLSSGLDPYTYGVAGASGPQAPSAGQHVSPEAVVQAMEDVAQLERLVGKLTSPHGSTHMSSHASLVAPVVQLASVAESTMGLGSSQSTATDLVGRMLKKLAKDRRLLQPVLRAVQEFAPALEQLVQHDSRFFIDGMHPARRLLDEITRRSLAFESEDAPGFSRFMRLLDEAVGQLREARIEDATPFETVLKALEAAWEVQVRQRKTEQKAEEQALWREMQAEKIACDFRQLPDWARVPVDIADFVTGPWAYVVALAMESQSEDGSAGTAQPQRLDPQALRALVPLLLWGAQPERAGAEPERLTRVVPEILAQVQTGLESIAYPRDKAQSFLQRLTELLQAGLAATAVPAAHPFAAATQETAAVEAAQEPPLDSPAKPEQGATFSAEQTQRQPEFVLGTWVELVSQGRTVRTQLTWISPNATLFLFTGADGSTQSMTLRMRDKLLAQGNLRLV